MPDQYCSMTALYADSANTEETTYGKRWRRHEWIQIVEGQATDNSEGPQDCSCPSWWRD
jgi:hypothetical protein